jgi:PspA-Associated protein
MIMIVRILGDAQYEVPDAARDHLNLLDDQLRRVVDDEDTPAFRAILAGLQATVRAFGDRIPDSRLTSSDLVFPGPDSRLHDIAALIGDESLIPG